MIPNKIEQPVNRIYKVVLGVMLFIMPVNTLFVASVVVMLGFIVYSALFVPRGANRSVVVDEIIEKLLQAIKKLVMLFPKLFSIVGESFDIASELGIFLMDRIECAPHEHVIIQNTKDAVIDIVPIENNVQIEARDERLGALHR